MVDLSLIKPEHLWYIVGFIATDGNLSRDGRHISLVTKDRSLLVDIRNALHVKNKIGIKSHSGFSNNKIFVLQLGDKKFYNYLLSIGLIPKKSLTLGTIKVHRLYFADFLRGVIDGDGNISTWTHRANKNKQWSLRVFSGSLSFIEWLLPTTENFFGVRGKIHKTIRKKRNPMYEMKFGKFAAKIILEKCYYKECLALKRKYAKAKICLSTKNGLNKYGNVVLLSPGGGIGLRVALKMR